jgi:C4-dicarboxylate transporter DctQ subunit
MSRTPETTSAIEPLPPEFTAQEALPQAGWLGKVITSVARVFAVGILIAMVVLVVEVFLRYVFNAPTVWAHETTTFLSAVTFIFGGLYCVARNSHIRVVLIYDVVRSPVRRILDILISIACLCASLFFAWAAWLMALKAIYRPDGSFFLETSGSAWNPPTPALLKLFLLAVLVTMSIQFLILTFNYARGLTPPKRHENV